MDTQILVIPDGTKIIVFKSSIDQKLVVQVDTSETDSSDDKGEHVRVFYNDAKCVEFAIDR